MKYRFPKTLFRSKGNGAGFSEAVTVSETKSPGKMTTVATTNFWPGYVGPNGWVHLALLRSLGAYQLVDDQDNADLVLASVFPHERVKYPEKTIALIRENQRPNYEFYRFSISSDFDDYGGRNCRVPIWYSSVEWTSPTNETIPIDGHGYEPPLPASQLLNPQNVPDVARPKFCCLVTRYREPFRALAVEALSEIGQVDVVGLVTGSALKQSKYEFLKDYRFNLCFENSIFPGYYTEKPVQAWGAGCVPLYFSDERFDTDFNPRAIINRISYRSMDAFLERVKEVDGSPHLIRQYLREPLLRTQPDIGEAIEFIRRALAAINEAK